MPSHSDQPDRKSFPLAKRAEVKSRAHDVQRFYPTAHDVDKRFDAMINAEFDAPVIRLMIARQVNAFAADQPDPYSAAAARDRAYQLFPSDRW